METVTGTVINTDSIEIFVKVHDESDTFCSFEVIEGAEPDVGDELSGIPEQINTQAIIKNLTQMTEFVALMIDVGISQKTLSTYL